MSAEGLPGPQHILVTGGAGYIGSVLVGALLTRGHWVTVVDSLLFGGESLVMWLPSPHFHFVRGDVSRRGPIAEAWEETRRRGAPPVRAVVHLAAIAGHPVAEAAGREAVWRQNVEAVRTVFAEAERLGAKRFVLASTSSVYGRTPKGEEIGEEGPLNPLSLYAESKVEAERALQEDSRGASCATLVFRFATAFGISPRMRFDLLFNQFVEQAYERGELEIYHGDQSRTFVHVRDIAEGVIAGLACPDQKIRGQVLNLGIESGTCTKDQLVDQIVEALPGTRVRRPDRGFGGDERDLRLSFARMREALGFRPRVSLPEGIAELVSLLRAGLLPDPGSGRYRNAAPIAAQTRPRGVNSK